MWGVQVHIVAKSQVGLETDWFQTVFFSGCMVTICSIISIDSSEYGAERQMLRGCGWLLAKDPIHHLSSLGQPLGSHSQCHHRHQYQYQKNWPSALLSSQDHPDDICHRRWSTLGTQVLCPLGQTARRHLPIYIFHITLLDILDILDIIGKSGQHMKRLFSPSSFHTSSWWYRPYPQHLSLEQQLMIIQRLGVSTFSCKKTHSVMWQPCSLFLSWSAYILS